MPILPTFDWSSHDGAFRMASMLNLYWFDRGFPQVLHTIEMCRDSEKPGSSLWVVRSNLVDGLPPGATATAVAKAEARHNALRQ